MSEGNPEFDDIAAVRRELAEVRARLQRQQDKVAELEARLNQLAERRTAEEASVEIDPERKLSAN